MGQSLPLPERIPHPDNATAAALSAAGVIVDYEDKNDYLAYRLPSDWQLVDRSYGPEDLEYHIVDDEGMTRFSITGAWNGSCDENLTIEAVG